MLKINLLPETARKNALSPIEQFHRTPLMWIAVSLLLLAACSFLVPIMLNRQHLAQVTHRIEVLEPKKVEVDQLQQMLQQLRAQQAAFQGLDRRAGGWAKRLNTLSNATPDGVWYTELTLSADAGLLIHGSAIGQAGNETVNIGRLVQELKADPDFAAVVKDIQIESIKRFQLEEVEVVQFTLACALTDGAIP